MGFSEASPCPACGRCDLCWRWPVAPDYVSDEEAEQFHRNSEPDLVCASCGEIVD